VTLRDRRDLLVCRETTPATIGAVEAPQQRAEHPQCRPSERPLVLASLVIRTVVGRRSGPDAGFGIAVEPMFGCGPEYLLAARTQMTRHELQQIRAPRPACRQRPCVRANLSRWRKCHFRLTAGLIVGEADACQSFSFPGLRRVARPAPEAGCVVFWASARSRRLWTSRQAAAKSSVYQIVGPQDVAGCPYKPTEMAGFSYHAVTRSWDAQPRFALSPCASIRGACIIAAPDRRGRRGAADQISA